MSTSSPIDADDLLRRARALAGLPLAALAHEQNLSVPSSLRRKKGFIGRLLEDALGADGGNFHGADFQHLQIELKTIPVDLKGRPRESTFVTSVELANPDALTWESSPARAKLSQVLFIPILTLPELPVAERIIGSPLLWRPSPHQEARLKADWSAHMNLIRQGYVEEITARDGEILQIRPKGANAKSLTWGLGPDGEAILTLPRGFYLRPSFTAKLLQDYFAIPAI